MKRVNVHWISTFELPSSCHKRPGLLTYLFYCSCSAVAWNQLSLKDWINFGIYWKNLLSHSQPWPWVCGLGLWLGLACIWLSLGLLALSLALALALTHLALLTSLFCPPRIRSWRRNWRSGLEIALRGRYWRQHIFQRPQFGGRPMIHRLRGTE